MPLETIEITLLGCDLITFHLSDSVLLEKLHLKVVSEYYSLGHPQGRSIDNGILGRRYLDYQEIGHHRDLLRVCPLG